MPETIKVMIVEDNTQIIESIRRYFVKKPGMEIVGAAGNSLEAIELLKTVSPDLIILDLVMPKSDGFTLLKYLKEVQSPNKPKVIVLSAVSQEQIVKDAYDLNVSYYMVKPFSLQDLYEHIGGLVGLEKSLIKNQYGNAAEQIK